MVPEVRPHPFFHASTDDGAVPPGANLGSDAVDDDTLSRVSQPFHVSQPLRDPGKSCVRYVAWSYRTDNEGRLERNGIMSSFRTDEEGRLVRQR